MIVEPIEPAGQEPREPGKDVPVSFAGIILRALSRRGAGKAIPIPRTHRAEAARVSAAVERLNARIAACDISGVAKPTFRRVFIHSLELGGRYAAQGGFSHRSKARRSAIRIDGEPVAEVDICASQATIFLALTDAQSVTPGRDLYDFEGLPREAVTRLIVSSLGRGFVARQWGPREPAAVRAVNIKRVQRNLFRRHPSFQSIRAALPTQMAEAIPEALRLLAVGQRLTFIEAAIVTSALERMASEGVVALPLHDAVLVPRGTEEAARDALRLAFMDLTGVEPTLRVSEDGRV